MPTGVPRLAMWALVVMLLASALTATPGVLANNPSTYAINGYVHVGTSIPVPAGVTVDLISGATHEIYTTTTGAGGRFSFTNGGTGGALVPGSWGLWVPPEGNVTLGAACNPCAVLPASQAPAYEYETAQNLTSATSVRAVNNVSLLEYNATLSGIATKGATPAIGANVELLAPAYNGLVLVNNTTKSIGNYTMKVPWGSWVLETDLPGVPTDQYDFQAVTVDANKTTDNPQISNYLTYGTVYQRSNPSQEVPFGGNVTVYDPTTTDIYSQQTPGGGFYAIGTYPAGFSGGAANTFDVVLQTIGYQTVWYPLTVSGSDPTGGANPHDVTAGALYTPASYNTTLTYSKNFAWLNTSTQATLRNDSVFPELANASVGQLWAQLALDWQHNLTFDGANVAAVETWLNQSGPFFPAGAAQATISALGYNETPGGDFAFSSTCTATSWCGLGSAAGISYSWAKNYEANGTVVSGQKNYTATFNFRHPTNSQAINYTIDLPKGYVLKAGNPVPDGASLVADGANGTWTSFTLVSEPYSSASSTATFSFVKYGNITANVNASVSQFAFSKANVLNSTHGNYSVIVGQGQNVTFSAAGTTFPSGTNLTTATWTWGDGQSTTTTHPIDYHTYSAKPAEYNGTLTVTSSGGTSASVGFHVYVGNGTPTGTIVSNASASEKFTTSGNVPYLIVNYSTSLQFNATGFVSNLYSGGPAGIISIASWNATAGTYNQTENLTASSGAYVDQNFTVTFNDGTGATADNQYLTQANINGSTVNFLGWRYNISVWVWDGIGHAASDYLTVLVRDTEKPTAVATLQDSSGKNVTSAGVVEGSNFTAEVKLVGQYSTDANGGSIVLYVWNITNPGNSSANWTYTIKNASGLRAPAAYPLWLDPQTKAYNVNLTVTDRAGNKGWDTTTLTVAVNTSKRPVLAVGNLTVATTLTDGTSYTVWANVTNTLGQNSTAENVSVAFYLLSPSGSGNDLYLGNSPGTTVFYGYTNGTVNATSMGTGKITLKYNQTARAQISFTPSRTGTWELWVNATASNEFEGDYSTGGNQAHVTVTINPNQLTLDLEYGAVAGAIIVVAVVAFLLYRRNQNRPTGRSGRGADRAPKKEKPADDDDEDDKD